MKCCERTQARLSERDLARPQIRSCPFTRLDPLRVPCLDSSSAVMAKAAGVQLRTCPFARLDPQLPLARRLLPEYAATSAISGASKVPRPSLLFWA